MKKLCLELAEELVKQGKIKPEYKEYTAKKIDEKFKEDIDEIINEHLSIIKSVFIKN